MTKVACVGDSITAGAGTSSRNDYPSILGRLLGDGWQVRNFGSSGKTMMRAPNDPPDGSYWTDPSFAASQAYAPDVVVLMLGTNDSKTTNWRGGHNTYDADGRAMIDVYQTLPSRPRVLVGLPPPAVLSSFAVSSAVIRDEIVPTLRKIAGEIPGVGLIDVFDAFLPAPARYFIGDGVHPNDLGAALIAQTVLETLTSRV